MEKEYEDLKLEVGKIFESVKKRAISQNIMEEAKLEMNLKIIQAVVMRFIRIILFEKKGVILCTSSKEIMEYVQTGFLRYFSKSEDRKIMFDKAKKIENILLMVEERKSLKSA